MKKLSCSGRVHPFFLLLIIILVAVPMGFYGMYLYISPSLPDMRSLQKAPVLQPLQVYSADNQLIAEYGGKLSTPVDYKKIPPQFIHAFLAAEDSSFFEHNGVSFKGLGRALTESLRGADTQTGGSTITMQVAKNYYLTPERTLKRKLTEIFLARKIEQNLSKADILSLYVNKIFLGKNAYGIAAAAKVYYNKSIDQLSLAEMAMIAGLPKAPSRFNPAVNPERALERRNWILGRMLQLGYIDQLRYEKAVAEPVKLNMVKRGLNNRFPYVGEMVRAEMVSRFGEHAVDSGYKVYTTIHSKRQQYAEQAVQDGLEAYDRRHGWRGAEANGKALTSFRPFANTFPAQVIRIDNASFDAALQDGRIVTVPWAGMSWARKYINANAVGAMPKRASEIVNLDDIVRLRPSPNQGSWNLVQIPKVQGQLIAMNPNSGAIEAIVGGYNYYQSKFNRAVQGWRQPGSTIKPFIYALALERGMTPVSVVNDSPISFGNWSPKNSDGRYLGPIPLRRALYLSRNTVSVRLLQMVGLERARQLLMDFGLQETQIPRNYTIALGTPQVLPVQMATGYATFANGGYRIQPYFISKVKDATGKLIFEANPEYACIPCQFAKPKQIKVSPVAANTAASGVLAQDDLAASEAIPTMSVLEQSKYRQAKQILKSSSAVDMANILRDVIQHGTGRAALQLGRDDLGGKTGTTNDAKDAWFAGFNRKLVAVAWVGFDAPTTLGKREYGGVAALPIWIDFMDKSLKDTPPSWVLDVQKTDKTHSISTQQGSTEQASPTTASATRQRNAAAPPLARPLFRATESPLPENQTATGSIAQDFADLPTTQPSTNPSVQPNTATPANDNDGIDQLINQMN